MVLEHLILHPQLALGGHLQILSDSQTTVGIISQGWKSYSYKNTIEEIKKAIKTLTHKRITVELLWIPGNAGLQGNEKSDQLAKEGAEEARSMPEETRTVSIQDIKVASHKACLARWQSRWQNASTGRQYHEYVPQVDFKRQFDLQDKVAFNRILQLQTGYTVLNAHRHKVGQKVSPLCACGCPETTDQLLLQCQSYSSQRERLIRSLYTTLGITTLDLTTLLGNDNHPELDHWRETIWTELGHYLEETGRFSRAISAPGTNP